MTELIIILSPLAAGAVTITFHNRLPTIKRLMIRWRLKRSKAQLYRALTRG